MAGRVRNRSVFRSVCGRVCLETDSVVEPFVIGLYFADGAFDDFLFRFMMDFFDEHASQFAFRYRVS